MDNIEKYCMREAYKNLAEQLIKERDAYRNMLNTLVNEKKKVMIISKRNGSRWISNKYGAMSHSYASIKPEKLREEGLGDVGHVWHEYGDYAVVEDVRTREVINNG